MAEEPSRDDRHGDAPGQTPRDPWRVEGSRQTGQQQPGGKAGAAATWITVLVILGLYVVAIFVLSPHSGPTRLDIPYSVFREQVQQRNVEEITATGETIEGRLRKEITYDATPGP